MNAHDLLKPLTRFRDMAVAGASSLVRTSGVLGLLLFAVVLFSLLVGWRTLVVVDQWHHEVRSIEKNAAPAVLLADQLRTQLFSMVADSANDLVVPGGDLMETYAGNEDGVVKNLVAAASHVSFGERETAPIGALTMGLASYEGYLRAASLAGPSKRVTMVIHASDVMQQDVVPSAEQLGDVNRVELERGLHAVPSRATVLWSSTLPTIALALWLFVIQAYLIAKFRRFVNLPLLLASVLVVVMGVQNASDFSGGRDALSEALDVHFKTVSLASRAKALLYGAHADESFYLITDDKDEMTDQFRKKTKHLISADLTDLPTHTDIRKAIDTRSAVSQQGYLADVINNKPDAAERKILAELVDDFARYLEIDTKIRALDTGDDHAGAVALSIGKNPGELNYVFGRLDAGVSEIVKQNREAYETGLAASEATLDAIARRSLLVLVLAGVLSVVGIRARMAEFS